MSYNKKYNFLSFHLADYQLFINSETLVNYFNPLILYFTTFN